MQVPGTRATFRRRLAVFGALTVGLFVILPFLDRAAPDAASPVRAAGPSGAPQAAPNPRVLDQLQADYGGPAELSFNRATGAVRFLRLPEGPGKPGAGSAGSPEATAWDFLARYGSLFGIRDPQRELLLTGVETDTIGETHLSFEQRYQGLPVFGTRLKVHLDTGGAVKVVNGAFVPGITVDPTPDLGAGDAGAIAVAHVAADEAAPEVQLRAEAPELMVFREGFVKGVAGESRLVYEVEVGDGLWVREFVYVDAHDGDVVDQITGHYDGLDRKIYDGAGKNNAWNPATDPAAVVLRAEGQGPTGDEIADRLYDAAGDVYDMFFRTFGRDSWDGAGATMHSAARFGNNWLNAQWTGSYTRYGVDVDTDDIVAHEWGHAYTERTHGLIYQWQSGALNESYSDIFGEIVDQLNEYGLDDPARPRSENTCSLYTPGPTQLEVRGSPDAAGSYPGSPATYGPRLDAVGKSGNLVLAVDGSNFPNRGCQAFTNAEAMNGQIALIDSLTCGATVKGRNAQNAGAIAAVIIDLNSDAPGISFGRDAELTIPIAFIGRTDGDKIKAAMAAGLQATINSPARPTDDSVRWLMGEESAAFGGSIRDGWTPTCYGHPGKVSDTVYHCSTGDSGGVHRNSGIPNRTFALMVDGGRVDGRRIPALGWTQTAHIYWRAMSTYQVPVSDFPDHADALEQSCRDLIGVDLNTIFIGTPSGDILDAADCAGVAEAVAATELRRPPSQCNFQPMLAHEAPPICGGESQLVFGETFEEDGHGWNVGRRDVADPDSFDDRDWELTDTLLGEREGRAYFAPNPTEAGNCTDDLENGALYLDSPPITLPEAEGVVGRPRLSFAHYVSTQAARDGGNVKIRVNGGAWQNVAPRDFLFNGYSVLLTPAGPNPTNRNIVGPLEGEFAWHGTDQGTHKGSWGESQIDLSRFAEPGDTVEMRFELGTNGCTGRIGWYVDDVQIHYCSTCGDSRLDARELCDDGNAEDGDGCSASCRVEWGHSCSEPVPGAEAIADGGFEGGVPGWTETTSWARPSTCDPETENCPGAMALEGDGWAQLGYYTSAETPGKASLAQSITVPEGVETLRFQAMAPICSQRTVTDTMRVYIDSTPAITLTASGAICGLSYDPYEIDLRPYADGAAHELSFEAAVNFGGGFVVDAVSAASEPQASVCRFEGPPGIYLPWTGNGMPEAVAGLREALLQAPARSGLGSPVGLRR